MKPTVEERFMAKVRKEPSGCWMWAGAHLPSGHGSFRMTPTGSAERAHKAAWLLFRGPIPSGHNVFNAVCLQYDCVSPEHLATGTALDRARVQAALGGAGELNRTMTDVEVGEARRLRADGWSYKQVAALMGRDTMTIWGNLNRERIRERNRQSYRRKRGEPIPYLRRRGVTLTPEQVQQARVLYAAGQTQEKIAQAFGVAQSWISRLVRAEAA